MTPLPEWVARELDVEDLTDDPDTPTGPAPHPHPDACACGHAEEAHRHAAPWACWVETCRCPRYVPARLRTDYRPDRGEHP